MKEALLALLLLLALFGCAGGGATSRSTGGAGLGVSAGEIPADGMGIELGDDRTALPHAVGTGEVGVDDISDEDLGVSDLSIDLSDDGIALPERIS